MRKAFIAILLCAAFILHFFAPITSAQAIEEAETISQESEEVSSEENSIAPNEETEVKRLRRWAKSALFVRKIQSSTN